MPSLRLVFLLDREGFISSGDELCAAIFLSFDVLKMRLGWDESAVWLNGNEILTQLSDEVALEEGYELSVVPRGQHWPDMDPGFSPANRRALVSKSKSTIDSA